MGIVSADRSFIKIIWLPDRSIQVLLVKNKFITPTRFTYFTLENFLFIQLHVL